MVDRGGVQDCRRPIATNLLDRWHVVWAGRLLLLGLVAFWWGGYVIPHLFSLVFPELLPISALPAHLDPDWEGAVANKVSAAAFALVALLALINNILSRLQAGGLIVAGGWAVLAVTGAFLAWAEITDAHNEALGIGKVLFGPGNEYHVPWPVLLAPLIIAFMVAMAVFVRRGLRTPAIRTLFTFGLIAWLLAPLYDAWFESIFHYQEPDTRMQLGALLEETLEFGGTLLIGCGAAIALWGFTGSRPLSGVFVRRWRWSLIGSLATVAVLGGLVIAFVFHPPLVDAHTPTHIGTFQVTLSDRGAVTQELHVPAGVLEKISLRLANRDPGGNAGTVIWRVMEGGRWGDILREGRLDVAARDGLSWESIFFVPPMIIGAEGQRMALQLEAALDQRASLHIGATKLDRYEDGRLWVNEAQAWRDQDLEFVAYAAPELTRNKLRAIWHLLTSDWRWPALMANLAFELTIITLIPVLLIGTVLPRRDRRHMSC